MRLLRAVAACTVRVIGSSVTIALSAVATLTPACQDRSCEFAGIHDYRVDPADPASPPAGQLVSADYWQTTDVDSDWLDFPPAYGWAFIVPEWRDQQRPFAELHAYVSESRHPVCHEDGCDRKQNFTEGAGNVAEFSRASPGVVWIINSTCAHFYLRVVMRAVPLPSTTPDAGVDAPADAPVDAASG
jgi:hypothetical protein